MTWLELANVAKKNQETPEAYLEPSRASMIEIFDKNS